MKVESLARPLSEHSVCRGLLAEHIEFLSGCARQLRVPAGRFLSREGQPADALYVVRVAKLAVEVQDGGRGAIALETVGPDDALGWAALNPPSSGPPMRGRSSRPWSWGPAANLQMSAAAAIVAYVIYDPLSPNWTIEEKALDGDTYLLSRRAKSFRIGGDGESGLIIRRRALQLQRERGFAGYRIVNYSEGVESSTPFTHRYAEGTIKLVRADPGKQLPLAGDGRKMPEHRLQTVLEQLL